MNTEIRFLAQHLLHAGSSPLSGREPVDLHDKVDRLAARMDGLAAFEQGAGRPALRLA